MQVKENFLVGLMGTAPRAHNQHLCGSDGRPAGPAPVGPAPVPVRFCSGSGERRREALLRIHNNGRCQVGFTVRTRYDSHL